MKVTGCKHLSWDQDQYTANLAYISGGVVWERRDPEGRLQLCQFCTLRGRINNPQGCLTAANAQCSNFESITRDIENPRNP